MCRRIKHRVARWLRYEHLKQWRYQSYLQHDERSTDSRSGEKWRKKRKIRGNDIRHYPQFLVETHRIINAPTRRRAVSHHTQSVMDPSVDWLRVVRELDIWEVVVSYEETNLTITTLNSAGWSSSTCEFIKLEYMPRCRGDRRRRALSVHIYSWWWTRALNGFGSSVNSAL